MHRLGLIRHQNATHRHVVAVIILIIVITAIAMFKLLSPICDATTFYNETQIRPNTETQAVPEAVRLDHSLRFFS